MPSPVEALPCGSRSTISTVSPTAASAVPRLMAVVVFPTPPFWLARARTRGTAGRSYMIVLSASRSKMLSYFRCLTLLSTTQQDDTPGRVGLAGDQLGFDTPRFRGCGQFSLNI